MHLGSGERCSVAADLSLDPVQPLSPPAGGLRSRERGGGRAGQAKPALPACLGPLCGLSGRVVGALGSGGPAGSDPSSLRGGGAQQRSCPRLIEFLRGGCPLPPAELASPALLGPWPGPRPLLGLSLGSLGELLPSPAVVSSLRLDGCLRGERISFLLHQSPSPPPAPPDVPGQQQAPEGSAVGWRWLPAPSPSPSFCIAPRFIFT